VVIVGGGVLGTMHAVEARRRGFEAANFPPKPQSPQAGTKMPILARQVGMMASQDKRGVASSWRPGIGW